MVEPKDNNFQDGTGEQLFSPAQRNRKFINGNLYYFVILIKNYTNIVIW